MSGRPTGGRPTGGRPTGGGEVQPTGRPEIGATVRAFAPAKLNLFLELLSRRNDGFHELETLMVPISIFDSLSFTTTSDALLTLDCTWAPGLQAQRAQRMSHGFGTPWENLPPPQHNLAWRALRRLQEVADVKWGGALRLIKQIPAAAGLGGASSDAATALQLANRAWGLGWTVEQLAEVAAELGSDVPFFLYQRAAICRGRGEKIEQLEATRPLHVVVVRPEEGLSTAAVFGQCQVSGRPNDCQEIVKGLVEGDIVTVARGLFNRLEGPAAELSPEIAELRDRLRPLGGLGFLMSGSGTSHFIVCWNHRHAQTVAGKLRSTGIGAVYQARTLSGCTW